MEGIRSIVNIKNSVNLKIAQLKINGKVNDEPEMVVNNFFVDVGPNTEKDVPKVPNIFPEKFLENKNQLNFIIAHIEREVFKKQIHWSIKYSSESSADRCSFNYFFLMSYH